MRVVEGYFRKAWEKKRMVSTKLGLPVLACKAELDNLKMKTYANPSVLSLNNRLENDIVKKMTRSTYMLCTKSPNRFRYADIFDGPVGPEFADLLLSDQASDTSPFFRFRRPSSDEIPTPEALLASSELIAREFPFEWECECEWPPSPSSPLPSTRRVFSIKKKVAKPRKMPRLK